MSIFLFSSSFNEFAPTTTVVGAAANYALTFANIYCGLNVTTIATGNVELQILSGGVAIATIRPLGTVVGQNTINVNCPFVWNDKLVLTQGQTLSVRSQNYVGLTQVVYAVNIYGDIL